MKCYFFFKYCFSPILFLSVHLKLEFVYSEKFSTIFFTTINQPAIYELRIYCRDRYPNSSPFAFRRIHNRSVHTILYVFVARDSNTRLTERDEEKTQYGRGMTQKRARRPSGERREGVWEDGAIFMGQSRVTRSFGGSAWA